MRFESARSKSAKRQRHNRMQLSRTDLILIFCILLSFATLLYAQTQMKSGPQIFLMSFGSITAISLLTIERFGNILFLALLGLALFLVGYVLTNVALDIMIPDRGYYVDTDGAKYRVNDFTVLLGIPVGIIIAPIFLRLYRKRFVKNTKRELVSCILYTLGTFAVYIWREIR